MRGAPSAILFGVVCSLAGCTLLVSFDGAGEVAPVEEEGGVIAPVADVFAPTADSGGATSDGGASMPECKAPPRVVYFLCDPGMFCGRRRSDYPDAGRERDLLRCEGQGLTATTCGVQCALACLTIDGSDDQCDPCADRADGTYCGREVGWTTRNADVSVRCVGGRAAATRSCGENKCRPCSGAERPSCCT